MSFKQFNLSDNMVSALEELSVYEPSDIQKEVIPLALQGKNLVGISQTGSGKTYAFLVPLLERIDVNLGIQAIIISPTRELATQLYQVTSKLCKIYNSNINVKKFIGGSNKESNVNNCHIVIGTPGRIYELFIKNSELRVDLAHTFIIDEADMVFEDNYLEQIDEIKSKLNDNTQFMVFSATISKQLSAFIKKYLKNTSIIDVSTNRGINSNISHFKIKCRFGKKDDVLVSLLGIINPYACLIFASKQTEVDRLYYLLSAKGFNVAVLHGGLEPRKRNRVIKEILSDKYQFIVCSDLASRGLDLKMITHVISYDLPSDINFYTHRSGRSGRVDNLGSSFILYDEDDNKKLHKILKLGINLEERFIRNGEIVEKVVSKKPATQKKVYNKRVVRVSPNYKNKRRSK